MTPNKEDYLKCIYEIGTEMQKITNKEIATRMQVSPPAVTEMIKRMKSENLILKDKENGYLLTDIGLELVSELYRKHRLIEVFLVHHLDYTSDQIHEEAEVLEHTVSDLFVERLDKLLGFPKTCPHGGTIPVKGELLVEINNLPLADTKKAGTYLLTRVHDSFDLLKYLEKYAIHIGDQLQVKQFDSFSNSFTLVNKGEDLQVSIDIAKQLYVEKIS
ncbi:MarR family transcriptional regulator [Streptococcus oralis subsp. tigurinus]|uniref:Manganese transport regulator n=1 Tax=Streptococcus oralis subsp. tigurinus TaxID=1077464 RepID=A0A1X1FVM6_STROR|nr:metal-dependent transcriptional regulator [Streptococcus oralis]ORO38400.1 MarR family transcriptional regulator [Streptococcus oralis subsp. tigurinus]